MSAREEQIRWQDFLDHPGHKWYVLKLKKMLLSEHLAMTKGNDEARIRYNLLVQILRMPRKALADIETYERDLKQEELEASFAIDS